MSNGRRIIHKLNKAYKSPIQFASDLPAFTMIAGFTFLTYRREITCNKCRCKMTIQSTLVISKSKVPSKTVRDIRTSTYQICSIEGKTI